MLTSRPATCGEAHSVLGPVPVDRLGVTMVHGHLLHDARLSLCGAFRRQRAGEGTGMTDEHLRAILDDNPVRVLPRVEAG